MCSVACLWTFFIGRLIDFALASQNCISCRGDILQLLHVGNASALYAYCIPERLCLADIQPLVSERVNDGSTIFIPDIVSSCQVELQNRIQSASARVRIATLKLTSFLVYRSPYIPVTLASLQNLNSPTCLET